MGRLNLHVTVALLDTATASRRAGAPTAPFRDLAVHWAFVNVAFAHHDQRRAASATLCWHRDDRPLELLSAASACYRTLFRHPRGHRAILEEFLVALNFVKLRADSLDPTDLCLKVVHVVPALSHRFIVVPGEVLHLNRLEP